MHIVYTVCNECSDPLNPSQADLSHREVSFEQVMRPSDETTAWSAQRIEKRATVRGTKTKGRCLFTNEACEPGQVVFVERPLLVALPGTAPKLWQRLQKLHEQQPLNLGTITFHFAALVSVVTLSKEELEIIRDKYVPDPDEDGGAVDGVPCISLLPWRFFGC